MKDKKKIIIIITLIIVIGILIADLVMFWTSAKEDGIGRGFSRYWRTEEIKD
jgi:flagellar basal body-associated protein FliL